MFGDPAVETPFREQIARIVADRHAPPRTDSGEEIEETAVALTRSGLFAREAVHTFRWSIVLDEHEVHRLFTTFSDWSADEVDRAALAVRDLGGSVTEHYSSWLIVTRPRDEAGR